MIKTPVSKRCIAALAFLGFVSWRAPAEARDNVEIKDSAGRVRVRLGDLSGDGGLFGLQILDEEGAIRAAVGCRQGETTLDLLGSSATNRVSVNLTDMGSAVTMGPREGWQFLIARTTAGELKATYTKNGVDDDSRVALVCHPEGDRQAIFRLYNGSDAALTIGADKKAAQMELLQNRSTAARLVALNGMGSRLQIGERGKGIMLNSLVDGSSALEISRGKPLLSVQASESGVGLAINHENGSPAVRVGTKGAGEIQDSRWDKTGKETKVLELGGSR